MKNPATSYVAATFHPTIGQRAHQSLSNAATPELGMIPQGIRVNAGSMLPETRNGKRNEKRERYEKRSFKVLHSKK